MNDIKRLVNQFREAIDEARDAGEFNKDSSFGRFPRGCCGDASDLLAQFLLENDIKTYYVGGTYKDWFHAWLITSNEIIIDITGDQFKYDPDFLKYDKPVYIGGKDAFHKLFIVEDRNVYENFGLKSLGDMCLPRLIELYEKITKFI